MNRRSFLRGLAVAPLAVPAAIVGAGAAAVPVTGFVSGGRFVVPKVNPNLVTITLTPGEVVDVRRLIVLINDEMHIQTTASQNALPFLRRI